MGNFNGKFTQFLTSLFVAGVLVASFQNCGQKGSGTDATSENTKALTRNGNGDPYLKADGTYVNLDVEGLCGGPTKEASVVVVKNGKATLTKDQCQDILPVDVTASSVAKEYNTDALFHGDKLYEKLDQGYGKYSEVLCRGSETVSNQEGFADVNLVKTGKMGLFNGVPSPAYEGTIKTAIYESGSVKTKTEFVPVVYKESSGDGSQVVYTFTNVRKHPVSGALVQVTSGNLSEYKLTVSNGTKATFSFTYPFFGIEMFLDSMDCYKH